MKKSTKLIIASLVVVGFLAVTYCVVNRAPSQELTADVQMQEIITSGGCLRCHSSNPDLPFLCELACCQWYDYERCHCRLSHF